MKTIILTFFLTASIIFSINGYTPFKSGSFTPVVSSGGGTLPTFSVASGTYTRIGRLVFFNIALENTSGGTAGSGSQQISVNLPFTTGANQLALKVPVGSVTNGTTEDVLYAQIDPNSGTMTLWVQTILLSNLNFSVLNCGYFSNLNTRKIQLMGKILID
jgi:hypothetical protein